jgi:hypothetical protein
MKNRQKIKLMRDTHLMKETKTKIHRRIEVSVLNVPKEVCRTNNELKKTKQRNG